ncbi:UNVERIFIED_CONTAM: hypothetical protein FKN15_038442 [Acipenser sinensis]
MPITMINTKSRLSAYGVNKLPIKGKCMLPCRHKNSTHMCEFYVADVSSEPILGLKDCVNMELVKLIMSIEDADQEDNVIKNYSDVFKGIGYLSEPYHIQIKTDVMPVVHAPRKIPITLTDKLKRELERMEELEVIAKVDKPTEWVNSVVIVEKTNGSLRVCLDPRELNAAICRQHFQIPTVDELTSKLAGSTWFSTLDASCGYWQIPLTEEASYLITFNTPFGRYRYLRLPFGINSAQEVFHKHITQLFEDLEGVVTYIDDIVIFGKDQKEHNFRLRQVLERARQMNLKFNAVKSKIRIIEVKYLGHTLNQQGVKPDPSKVQAIAEQRWAKDTGNWCLRQIAGSASQPKSLNKRAGSLAVGVQRGEACAETLLE